MFKYPEEKDGWERRGETSWAVYVDTTSNRMWLYDIYQPKRFKDKDYGYPTWKKVGYKFITQEEYLND